MAKKVSLPDGTVLTNVHSDIHCRGRACVIHNPTNHSMIFLPLTWRSDRGIFERTCNHGIGHPDPDQFPYWKEKGVFEVEASHGCCGCCRL